MGLGGDGLYSYTATATDRAGNVSPLSAPLSITLDTHPPQNPSIKGSSYDTTSLMTPNLIILGTAEPKTTLELFSNGTALGTTTTGSTGNWTFVCQTPLAPGTYNFTAKATDAAGTVSNFSGGYKVVIPNAPDFTAITPDTGLSNTDLITNSTIPTILGTADPSNTVKVYANGLLLGTTTSAGNGSWQLSLQGKPLSDGNYILVATTTNSAGIISPASAPLTLTIDTKVSVPAITGITPSIQTSHYDGVTNAQKIQLLGTADANAFVRVFQDGVYLGATQADGKGNWVFDNTASTLPAGSYLFTASALDQAGNVSSLSHSFNLTVDVTVDQTASGTPEVIAASQTQVNKLPPPVIAGISQTKINNFPTLVVAGTSEPGSIVTVTLNNKMLGTVTSDSLGNWTYNDSASNISNGNYLFSATATNVNGTVSDSSSVFQLGIGDTTQSLEAPRLAASCILGKDSSGNASTSSTPTLTGNAWANTVITILDGNTILGTAVVNASDQWTFTCPVLAKGIHNLRIEDANLSGFTGVESNVLTIDV